MPPPADVCMTNDKSVNGLDAELARLKRLVEKKMHDIDGEMVARGMYFSGPAIVRKVEEISQLLEDQITILISNFPGESDEKRIMEYIDQTKRQIYRAAKRHGLTVDKLDVLELRTDELKGVLKNRKHQIRAAKQKESIRYWVPVAISVLALIVSVVSLWIAGGSK